MWINIVRDVASDVGVFELWHPYIVMWNPTSPTMSALISEILRRRRCQEMGKMNIVPDIVPDIVVFLRCRSAHHMSKNGLSLRHRRHIIVLDYNICANVVVRNYNIVVFCYDVVVFCFDVVYWCRSFFALRYRIRCTDSQQPCSHAAMQPCSNAAMHHAAMQTCSHTAMQQVCLKLKTV